MKTNEILSIKFLLPLVILFSLLCGIIDLNQRKVQIPALFVLLTSAIGGSANTKYFWLSALIIGGGIFLSHLIALFIGCNPPYQVEPNIFSTFLALIPAFIGGTIGFGVNKIIFGISVK